MPTTVTVPDVGEIEFPDSMSESDIAAALNQKYGTPESQGPRNTLKKSQYAFAAGAVGGLEDAAKFEGALATLPPPPSTYIQGQREFQRAGQEYAWPKLDPFTGQYSGESPIQLAGESFAKQRKEQQERLLAPSKGIAEAAEPYRSGGEALTEETGGSQTAAKLAGGIGGMLPLLGIAAVPVVGEAGAISFGAMQSGGSTFEQAFKAYKDKGDDDETAQRKAEQDAVKSALASGLLYAGLPGPGKAVADRLLSKQLEGATPKIRKAVEVLSHSVQGGAVMGADALIRNAQAMQSYRPELTWAQAMEEAAKAALEGGATVGVIHGALAPYQFGAEQRAEQRADEEAITGSARQRAEDEFRARQFRNQNFESGAAQFPNEELVPQRRVGNVTVTAPDAGKISIPVTPTTESKTYAFNAQQQPESGQREYPGIPQGQDVQPNPPEVRQEPGGQAGGGGGLERTAAEPGETEAVGSNPLPKGFVVPVQFARLQEGMPSVGWFKIMEPFVTPETGRTFQPSDTTFLNSKQIEQMGYVIPPEEQAKFNAAQSAKVGGLAPGAEVGEQVPQFQSAGGFPVREAKIPARSIKLSADVPNFKQGADPETGIVPGKELVGPYDRFSTGPAIVWERLNGDLEIITGRHRWDLAKREDLQDFPVQIVREADGFTKQMAAITDAETNIKDNQGTIEDYAHYFRLTKDAYPKDAAERRGLLRNPAGRDGWNLGVNASDDLYAAWKAGRIKERQAVAVAESAPGDARLQQIGLKYALEGRDAEFIRNMMTAVRAQPGEQAETLDLFGKDDAAIIAMERQAARAAQIQGDIRKDIQAISGASKNPEAAKRYGIDVNPASAIAKVQKLRGVLKRWENWALHPDLIEQTREPAKPAPKPTVKESLILAAPESVEQQKARLAAEDAAKKEAAAKEKMQEDAAKPLKGNTGDLGQSDALSNAPDLFAPSAPTAETKSSPGAFGSKNKIVTTERADELKRRLKHKLSKVGKNLNVGGVGGFDPTIFSDAVQLGAYYIEGGFHRFVDWVAKMREDFGEIFDDKHLKSIYDTARITIESPRGESPEGRPAGLQPGLRLPGDRIVTARPEFTKAADESVIPQEIVQHLDPHQRQGAATMIRSMDERGGGLNADGTGAGKTRQALAVAHKYAKDGYRVVIVTKAETIKPDWKNNIFGGSYKFDSGAMGIKLRLARDGAVEPGEVGITTYENLNSVDAHTDRKTVLIFDESHALKNDSQRAKQGMRAIAKADKVLFMSATPADKPEHLYYLAPIGVMEGKTVQQALRDLGMQLVTIEKMVNENGRWVKRNVTFWAEDQRVSDAERNARFSALYDRMTERGAMIKREVSMDGAHVQVLKVALPPEAHEVQSDILRFFDAKHIDDLKGLRKATVLGHQRRQQEPFKIAPAVMLAKRELDAGRQVVIFVSRVNTSDVTKLVTMIGPGGEREKVREFLMSSEGTAKSLRAALEDEGIHDIAEIHGGSEQSALDAMADFQAGKKRVVIATIESGGTGINLDDTVGNRPRSMIVVTAPFDAVGNVQAAGRIWRLKTLSGANLYYLFGDTPVDDWNADIIGSKMAHLGAVVEGQVHNLNVNDPDLVSTDNYHEKVQAQSGRKAITQTETAAVPNLEWRPFKTKAGGEKWVSDATPEFWDWYNANGKKDNPLGLRPSKWQDKWQVWSDKPIASNPAESPSKPAFDIPEGAKEVTVTEGAGAGAEGIRKAINESGLSREAVDLANAMLDHPGLRRVLDWNRITTEIRQGLEGNAAGLSEWAQGLIQLSGLANETTFPHEVFHFIEAALNNETRGAINELRLQALQKIYGDAIPENLRSGQMTTADFLKSGLPIEQYPLINNGEFLAEFGSKRFAEDYGPRGEGWQGLQQTVRQAVRAIVNAVRRILRLRPDMEGIYRELLSGDWKPDPSTGLAYERRNQAQAQPPRNVREYNKRREFEKLGNERGTPEATLGAYGDIAELKRGAADSIGAGEGARRLLAVGSQSQLSDFASRDSGIGRVAFGNYDAVMRRVGASDPGLRAKVLTDAFRGMGDEQRRMIRLRQQLKEQQAKVLSKSFQDRLARLTDLESEKQLTEQAMKTYRNQIEQSAGDVLKQLQETGKSEAAYDALREQAERLKQMPDFAAAVAQRVQAIVDTVAASPEGFDLLTMGGKKSGLDIYNAYVDLLESTRNVGGAGVAGMVDPEMLSAEDRARVEAARQAALSPQDRAFAQLASAVLAANRDARNKMAAMALLKANPHLKAAITAVGEKFRRAYKEDPAKALRQIVDEAARLKKREVNAAAAWVTLHKELLPELERFKDLQEAVSVDDRVQNSAQWKELANRIYGDARAARVPDAIMEGASADSLVNEFTGIKKLPGPSGTFYEINYGMTRANVAKEAAKVRAYLADVDTWLNDPANAGSPDRAYWEQQRDFHDALLLSSTVLNPTISGGAGNLRSLTIPDFLFYKSGLPQTKISYTAANNFDRAYDIADQWFRAVKDGALRDIRLAANSHKLDPQTELEEWRVRVLNPLAQAYRNGKVLSAGDRLDNGEVITQQDLRALMSQARITRELMEQQKNLGREKVMQDGLVFDQWSANTFGFRAPQELGSRPGTTVPKEFSFRAKALARIVHGFGGNLDRLEQTVDQPFTFDNFVKQFLGDRRADFSKLMPWETAYREIVEKWRNNAPDAPRNIAQIVDYIDANTTDQYDKTAIREALLGEMSAQLNKFYRDFVGPEDEGKTTDVRAARATRASAFSTAHTRDVGSSFYYDYGAVTAPELRSMAMDSSNFHLVRFVRSLDALEQAYQRAIAELETAGGSEAQKAMKRAGMKAFYAGEDFRNWNRMHKELAEVQYLKEWIGRAFGRDAPSEVEIFGGIRRYTENVYKGLLSGPLTLLHVAYGSPMKMATVFGALDRSKIGSYAKALVYSLRSQLEHGAAIESAVERYVGNTWKAIGAGSRDKFWSAMDDLAADIYAQGRFAAEQRKFGMATMNQVGSRVANILAAPYSHGHLMDTKLAENWAARAGQIAFYRMLSGVEAPLETVAAIYPQMGYVAAYDATTKFAGNILDGIQGQARRAFEYMERKGTLGQFNLDDVKDPANQVPADMILPRGIFKKTQNDLNFARDWFQRAIDLPLQEAVLNYWKALRDTPKDKRGDVSFLAVDIADPQQRKRVEDARAGALFAVVIKEVHHASPLNRPLFLRTNRLARVLVPLMGWSTQSLRGLAQSFAVANHDPQNTRLMLKAMALVGLFGYAAMSQFGGETLKTARKLFSWFVLHEERPERSLAEGRTPEETGRLALMNMTEGIPVLRAIGSSLLEAKQGGLSMISVDQVNDFLRYANGVYETGDPTYGLANLLKAHVPITKVAINQLESQKGLIARRNAETLLRKYGPEELVKTFGAGHTKPTPLSPYREDLVNAIFGGDAATVAAAGRAFVNKAIEMGNDPAKAEKMLQQAVVATNPYQQVFGQKLSEDQIQKLKGQMTGPELSQLQAAETNWTAGELALGTGQPIGRVAKATQIGLPARRSVTGGILRRGATRNRIRSVRAPGLSGQPRAQKVVKLRRPVLRRTRRGINRLRRRARILV